MPDLLMTERVDGIGPKYTMWNNWNIKDGFISMDNVEPDTHKEVKIFSAKDTRDLNQQIIIFHNKDDERLYITESNGIWNRVTREIFNSTSKPKTSCLNNKMNQGVLFNMYGEKIRHSIVEICIGKVIYENEN